MPTQLPLRENRRLAGIGAESGTLPSLPEIGLALLLSMALVLSLLFQSGSNAVSFLALSNIDPCFQLLLGP